MNKLQLQVILSTVDKLSAPLKSAIKNTDALARSIKNTKDTLRSLETVQGKVDLWKSQKKELAEFNNVISKHKAKIRSLEDTRNKLANDKDMFLPKYNALKREVTNLERRYTNQLGKGEKNDALFLKYQKKKEALVKLGSEYEGLKRQISSNKKLIYNETQALKFSHKAKLEKVQSTRRLHHELTQLGVKTKDLSNAEKTIQVNIDKATASINRQNAAMEKANRIQAINTKYQSQVQWLKDKSERMANFGQKTLISGAATTGLLVKPAKEFAQAENAATNLKVAMMGKGGTVSEDFAKINQLAMDLGNRLPGTTADFQNLMTMLIRQGMSAKTILGGTGEAAALLSVQLNMMPEQAAEFAAKMQDATQGTEVEMLDLMDAIQRGFYAGVDSINMLGAFKNLAPALSLLKVKGKEAMDVLAPLVAQMDQVGMEGRASGNALRKVLQKGLDVDKVEETIAKMKKSGELGKQFHLDFTNGKGSFGGLDNLYQQLEKMKELSDVTRNKLITSIFGEDAEVNTVLSSMIEKGKAGYEEFANKLAKQATLNERVNAQLGTLSNIWEAATGTFTNLLVEVGATYAPQLKALVDQFGQLAEKVMIFVKTNPELVSSIAKWIGIGGSALVVIGGLSTLLSYTLYPVARLILGFSKLIKLNRLFSKTTQELGKDIFVTTKKMTSITGWGSIFNMAKTKLISFASSFVLLFGKMKTLSFWFNTLKTIVSVALSPIRLVIMGIGSALSLLVSPIGLAIAALTTGALLIYRNWEKVRAFFGGFWEGLKSGLAPVIEKFKPLGDLFGVVVGWIEKAVKWFLDLISPVKTTKDELDNAAAAGKKFGEWLAAGIDLVTTPIQWVMDSITWIKNNLPSIEKSAQKVMTNSHAGTSFNNGLGFDPIGNSTAKAAESVPNVNKWSGGYAGNGGKYEPMGIFHGGEYIMTKEATSRLGVPLLNALNYGKNTMLAAGLGVSVAAAQPVNLDVVKDIQHQIMVMPPIQVDDRAPLRQTQTQQVQITQPMNITIQVNATQGMDERALAREVARQIAQIQNQAQARARSDLRDRG